MGGSISAVHHYLAGAKATGTDDPKAIFAWMQKTPINDEFTTNGVLRPDGRMVHDVYLVQVKKPSKSKGPNDLAKLVSTIPGDKAFRPLDQGGLPVVGGKEGLGASGNRSRGRRIIRAMPDDVLLRAEHLTKSFAGFLAVKDVSLDVKRGSIHALIGPNGAGKSPYFNLLAVLTFPGPHLDKGREICRLKTHDVASLGIVLSSQIRRPSESTVLENVRVALQRFRSDSMLLAFGYGSAELDDRADALLAEVGLDGFADSQAAELP